MCGCEPHSWCGVYCLCRCSLVLWPRVLGLVAAVVLAVQVQAEGIPEVSEKFDIAAVPTFVFLAVRGCLPLGRGVVLACLNGRSGRAGRSSASKKVPMPQCWRRTS